MTTPISIVCLITSLCDGGAETMLYRLLSRLDRKRFSPQVISLVDIGAGPMSEKIQKLGVPVRFLGMRPGRPNPTSVLRLIRWLRQDQPDVIQTWMYHADLVGGLAARLVGGIPVVWGIRNSDLNVEESKSLTRLTMGICARLSRWLPERIVSCSEVARDIHTAAGYVAEKMVVIPNGSDLETFKPDPAACESVRKELQIPETAPVIGMMARFDPQKDHRNFVRAAKLLYHNGPDVYFVLCGDGVNWENEKLTGWIEEAGIRCRCHLLGRRDDIPRLTAALDIASLSSSFGEAFPNVICEAMSCGVPCVVTDVGDSARIVGQTGLVVPPRDPAALAAAWLKILDLSRDSRIELGMAARRRVTERYNLPNIVSRYENLFEEVVRVRGVTAA